MASKCNKLISKASISSLKSAIKSTLHTPSISIARSLTSYSPVRGFSITRSPSELGSVKSLLPLLNAVSAARMSTSCLSKTSRGCRALTKGLTGNSAGRNSKGRITIFHRGGGAKRLQRKIDLKRSTSSMGIVERIEYDPNRSSRIATVRWIEGARLDRQTKCNTIENFAPARKILEPTTTTISDPFSFSSLPGLVDQRKVAWSKSPFTSKGSGSKKTCVKDVFFSALASSKAKGDGASLSYGSIFALPRIAVAGAKPAFFAPRMRDEVTGKKRFPCEIRKFRTNSSLWANRIKRKAAVSWHSSRRQETLGLVEPAEHKEMKLKTGQVSKVDRAPVTYIIASHHLEAGKMVMNYDQKSKPSANDLLRPAQNAHTY